MRQQTGLPGSVGLACGQAGKESSSQLRMLETPCQHLSLLAGFSAPDIQVRKQPTSTASLDKLFPITSLLFWISWRRFAPALHYVPAVSAFIMWTHCETDAQSRLTSFCSVVVRACSSGASAATCILFGLVACHSTHAMPKQPLLAPPLSPTPHAPQSHSSQSLQASSCETWTTRHMRPKSRCFQDMLGNTALGGER